jgi:hypothetical protein
VSACCWSYILLMLMIKPLRDVLAESCWWRHCRDSLATVWCSCRVMLMTMLLSHTSNGIVETTWSWCDVEVESYWQQGCRVMLATALPSPADDDICRVMLVMTLLSWCWSRCDIAAESCWRCRCRDDLAVMRCRCQIMLFNRSRDLRPELWYANEVGMYLHYNHV